MKFLKILFLITALFFLSGCNNLTQEDNSNLTVTDVFGRKVVLKERPVKRIVAIGPGALRLVCYMKLADSVVGVEDSEKEWGATSRPYILAYPQLKNLPGIGQGGPRPNPNLESIIAVKPDVIFAAYLTKDQADAIQSKTNIPVILLSYGQLASLDINDIYNSLRVIGEVSGKSDRANQLIGYIKGIEEDLRNRTKDILPDKKPSVYVGALGMAGVHGIESTQARYLPFTLINAKNVADEIKGSGSLMLDKEYLIKLNPDIIFLDEGGLPLVKEDYKKNRAFYDKLKAFKNNKIYGQLPFNYYATNVEIALIDTYFAGKVIYPERFSDVNINTKADEIFKEFLGKSMFNEITKNYPGFVKIDFKVL
ncbi:iron complex transport system substrate-binding protein [Thermodesulfobium acidiphilum]|uniref:Iron complex transport system substrate-binding protein n=1 Tax=Thermodesulfobium acidiphilum TaxID=1794699 RepID=A0A2R4W1P9_THEAF|nr:iron ABC transporter substrate-binding protein [Thermodesulfobium acidiphilum]AWB10699.1 iron complex transport system substrate-binding protein [Thermodesulfobium acidiphilum]